MMSEWASDVLWQWSMNIRVYYYYKIIDELLLHILIYIDHIFKIFSNQQTNHIFLWKIERSDKYT